MTQARQGQEALSEALHASFRLLRWVMILLLLMYLISGVFVVRQHERGFVLMLGKIAGLGENRVRGPGIHWTLPQPLAEVVRVSTERVLTIESDTAWYFESDRVQLGGKLPPPGPTLDPRSHGYTLSGDANLLHSRWALRYTVVDPERYIFGISDSERLLHNELDHAVVKSSAQFNIDQALRSDIEAFRGAVDAELRQRIRSLDLGIEVQRVDLVAVLPPRQVAAAFDAVIAAEQESSKNVTEARSAAGRLLNEARGDHARILAEGLTYKRRVVNEAEANADYFNAVHEKYVSHPDITARTLLQDTLRRTLANVEEKYVIYKNDDGDQELRLQLSPKARKKTKR